MDPTANRDEETKFFERPPEPSSPPPVTAVTRGSDSPTEDLLSRAAFGISPGKASVADTLAAVIADAPSLQGLSVEEVQSRNRHFVNLRHAAEALTFVSQRWPHLEPADLLVYRYYLSEYNCSSNSHEGAATPKGGLFQRSDWDNYNLAINHTVGLAEQHHILSVDDFLSFNSLVRTGQAEDPLSALRQFGRIAFVSRPLSDLREVFDEQGTYRATGVQISVEGFLKQTRRTWLEQIDDRNLYQLMTAFREAETLAQKRQLQRDFHASGKVFRSPHELTAERVLVAFRFDPDEMLDQLRGIERHYRQGIGALLHDADSGKVLPGSADYLRRVATIAVQAARPVDMVHFAPDGMLRTADCVLQHTLLLFGYRPPAWFSLTDSTGGERENGTYLPEERYIEALCAALAPITEGRAAQHLGAVKISYRKGQ